MALSNLSKEHTTNILAKLSQDKILSNHTISKIKTQSSNMAKLEVLYKQMMNIKKEIDEVLKDIDICHLLDDVSMKCKKFPGQKYYLYKTDKDDMYFSRLSPSDYSYKHENSYVGCYLFDHDYIWKKME